MWSLPDPISESSDDCYDINLICYNLVTILVKKVLKYMYPTFYRIFPGERKKEREILEFTETFIYTLFRHKMWRPTHNALRPLQWLKPCDGTDLAFAMWPRMSFGRNRGNNLHWSSGPLSPCCNMGLFSRNVQMRKK